MLLASGIGLVILLSLGVWQVQRLAEKEAQIAVIEGRLAGPAVSLSDGTSALSQGASLAKVTVDGAFSGPLLRKISTLRGGPGFEIIQAFTSTDGTITLVSRGVVGEGQAINEVRGQISITGLLRRHEGGRGTFDADNDTAGKMFYWWDVPAMYQAATGSALRQPGLVLHLLPGSPGSDGLQIDPPKSSLRNNHLGYAITWFGLALVLVVMTGLFVAARQPT